MCVTLLLVLSICPAFTVIADESVVTLDLSNGCITISPTGYSQNGSNEVAYTGAYVITGTLKADTPLDIVNNSGNDVTFDITLDNARIIASTWCTALRIRGDSDITINITNVGVSEIRGYNHSALSYHGTANVLCNIVNPDRNTLKLGTAYSKVSEKVYTTAGGRVETYINGVAPDNRTNYEGHTCFYKPVWSGTVTEMTLQDFLDNTYQIVLENKCQCGALESTVKVSDKKYTEPECEEDGEGSYIAELGGTEQESPHYVLPKTGHSTELVAAKDPTCTEDGNIEHRKCKLCNKLFEDDAASIPLSDEDVIVSAKGHSPENDWTSDKKSHWHICSECGSIVDKDDHTFGDWDYTKKATYQEEGLKVRSCTVSGYKETVVIPIIIEDTETETTTEEITTEASTEATTEATTEVDAQAPQTKNNMNA